MLLFIVALLLTACQAEPLKNLSLQDSYAKITAQDGRRWQIEFESDQDATFSGTIRHVSRWHNSGMPFMTHDLLITTGDFSDPAQVGTWVFDHKFFYHYAEGKPTGSLHLLHTFPASQEIFEQLEQIEPWESVEISGREILKITRYNSDGRNIGYFKDMGCNTILVTAVTILDAAEPVP